MSILQELFFGGSDPARHIQRRVGVFHGIVTARVSRGNVVARREKVLDLCGQASLLAIILHGLKVVDVGGHIENGLPLLVENMLIVLSIDLGHQVVVRLVGKDALVVLLTVGRLTRKQLLVSLLELSTQRVRRSHPYH